MCTADVNCSIYIHLHGNIQISRTHQDANEFKMFGILGLMAVVNHNLDCRLVDFDQVAIANDVRIYTGVKV